MKDSYPIEIIGEIDMVPGKKKKSETKAKAKKSGKTEDEWFIPEESRELLIEKFKGLKDTVILEVFLRKGENDPYNTLTVAFCTDLARLSNKIETNINEIGSPKSKKYKVERSPTILFNPDRFNIRYTGAPIGEEGRSFLEAIMMVSTRESGLVEASKQLLSELKEERYVMIFVTPDCPYCPSQVVNAFRAAIERPDLVKAECVEATENIDLARTYNVGAVPHTVINHTTLSKGLQPEDTFIKELVTMEPTQMMESEAYPTGEAIREMTKEKAKTTEVDLIIIGGGPAGLTAGIYAQRSGLKSIIIEKDMIGGQVSITPTVENYPGFTNIAGKKLMDLVFAQAKNYVDIHEGEEVSEIKIGKKIEVFTFRGKYLGKAILFCTGAGYRKLGVPGEDKFDGHGVSYCATCDGYFFRKKKVIMVGGGNSALTDALYLKNLGANVAIVHRRDKLRAEQYLQDSIAREGIPLIWDSVVEEIVGKGKKITGIKLKNLKTKRTKIHNVEGVFIAIGEDPNSKLAGDLGVKLTDGGFIEVDTSCRTNIPRIFAAGDVTGGVRQIVTAVSEGATAALSVFADIANPYWLKGTK
jgi:thioredoxin reductase (NADPH)